MAFYPIRYGGYLLLAVAGWAAGRWVWPAGDQRLELREPGKVAGPGAGEVRSPAGPGPAVPPAKTAGVKPVDGKAAGREMRASGSEAGFRDRARQMALEPPPALTDFLAAVTDSEVLRATLLEDAVVWAFCRKPEQGLLLLSSLAGREEIGALTEKALRFFPPKDLPVVLAWYDNLSAGELKTAALTQMLPMLARNDYRKAIELVVAMPKDSGAARSNRETLLHQVVFKYSSDYIELGFLPTALAFPEEDREFLGRAMEQKRFAELRNCDVEKALQVLTGPEGAGLGISLESFFTGWAQSDPIRGAEALAQLQPENVRPQVYHQFTAKWAEGNVGMASAWVRQLPKGGLKQGAVSGLVMSLAEDYPVEAVIWAGTYTDSVSKVRDLKAVTAKAQGKTVPGLTEAVNALNLTPEERAKLNLPNSP